MVAYSKWRSCPRFADEPDIASWSWWKWAAAISAHTDSKSSSCCDWKLTGRINHNDLSLAINAISLLFIDLMHMTSQKGARVCWGSNEALPRAPSPSMQPAGQPLHAIPPGWPGPAHWLSGWAPMRSASTTRAARQVLTPNMASLLWRRDVNA